MQDVPVKSIRIFSAETNEIRTVQVSTMLSIGVQISGATNKNNQSGNLYLFHNKHGRLSLATPNYAGNVSADQSDVMLGSTIEYIYYCQPSISIARLF